MFAIEIRDLVKKYKNGVCALNGLNMNVNTGNIFPCWVKMVQENHPLSRY